jgi:hypothetical protein
MPTEKCSFKKPVKTLSGKESEFNYSDDKYDSDIRHIIFKDLDKDGKFAHGTLGDFKLVIMKKMGILILLSYARIVTNNSSIGT